MADESRAPPSNVAAERSVLGCVLRWPACLADVAAELSADDFYWHANRLVWQAMLRVSDAGRPVDVVTVAEELRRTGHTADAPPAYLAELWDGEATGAQALWHARLVRDAAVRRHLLYAATTIAQDAQVGGAPAEEILESAERRVLDIGREAGQAVPLRQAVVESVERIEAACSGKARQGTVATGFFDLDRLTGGLHAGELTVIASRPSVGKSALAVNLLRCACVEPEQRRAGALVVSLEMSRVELSDRLLCCCARVGGTDLRDGTLTEAEWGNISTARNKLDSAPVFIDDTPSQRVYRIAATSRRLRTKGKIGLVLVDYLQLVEPENRRDPRHEQVGGVSRRLKLLAKELSIPVVAVAQVNRAAEDRQAQRPRLADLRESGSIEADADNVWLLHRDEDRPGSLEVIIAKQRNGPTDSVWLAWQRKTIRFDNYAADPERY